jgi:hypothetical protein
MGANNAERSLRSAGNAAGGVLGRRVRDGVAMTAASRTANGELASIIQRFRATWEQRRREQREFTAWLEITAKPLW